MKLVYDMAEAADVAFVGGKAAALARLAAAGFPPPAFFAIAPEAFDGQGLRAEASAAFDAALARLGPGPFAVRSSGRAEDGAAHSHAGQFLSRLDVVAEDVESAAVEVWRSGFTDSIAEYRRVRGVDDAGGAPAVIVQRMVAARAAGVAFSADPVSGRRDRIVISATAGLADRLVSGEVDGADYVVERPGGKVLASADGAGPLTPDDVAQSSVAWLKLLQLEMLGRGQYMTPRDKGPLFIVYPYDSNPDLKNQKFYSRSVWQVARIEVKQPGRGRRAAAAAASAEGRQ